MKKLLYVLLVLALMLPLAACGPAESVETPEEVSAPAEEEVVVEEEEVVVEEEEVVVEEEPKEPILIGSIQDLSGPAAEPGQANAWGAEYAIQVVNENGGIDGRMLEIITLDCKNDLNEGINAYRKLVDEYEVVAIIGPPLSNPASGWVEISEEDQMPIVGHFMDEVCTTDPDTGEPYPYMFLAEPSCSQQSFAIAKFAMEELGLTSFATLYNTGNSFAVAHAKPFMDYVEENGGSVLAEETFTWTDTDYSAQALKIVQAEPEAVFLSDYANQASMAYDFLRDAGFEGVILGANTLSLPFPSLVKNDIYDVYFLQNYDMLNPEAGGYELFQIYMEEEGADYPKGNVAFGWDAVQVLVAAMRQAEDPTDGAELRDLLAKTEDVPLAERTITIDPATHRPSNMGMYIAEYDENNELKILTYIEP
jgi:branched-chain amino acid transport system substrate-binding protein